jgi:hypothetical protein
MSGRDEELLSAYIDGELSAAERASVEQWLTDDVAARELLDELSEASGLVRSLPRHAAPPDLRDAVLARLRAPQAARPPAAVPPRPNWRRRTTWVAVSAAGLLLAFVLYQHRPSADRLTIAHVEAPSTDDFDADADRSAHVTAMSDIIVANEGKLPESLGVDFGVVRRPADQPLDQPRELTLDPAALAQAEALLMQEELELALESGQRPVPGESLAHLGHLGHQVVIFQYRVVDTQDIFDRVQVILTQNGIIPIGEPSADANLLARRLDEGRLQAFYLVAPTTKFNTAVDQITDLDIVTGVSTNTVAFVEEAVGRGSDVSERSDAVPAAVSSPNRDLLLSERESRAKDQNSNGVAAAPEASPTTPLSVSATEEAKPAAQFGDQKLAGTQTAASLSYGVPASGPAAEASGGEAIADAYQVRVPARPKLIEELEELEQSAPQQTEAADAGRENLAQAKSGKVVQSHTWEFVRWYAPPPAKDQMRAVMLFIPEKPE